MLAQPQTELLLISAYAHSSSNLQDANSESSVEFFKRQPLVKIEVVSVEVVHL